MRNALTTTWYAFRVMVGFVIHIVLTFFALFNIEVSYELVHWFYKAHPEEGVYISPRVMAAVFAVSMLFALMSGVYWVKSMYIQHFLPEIMAAAEKALSEEKQ